MSGTLVGILGFACIVAIVVTLFKSKTLPSTAFIVFPMILALVLALGKYYTWEDIASLIKSGFSSTGPTAALFVFSVLYFGIMTDAGMFDVIIGKLMLLVKDSVVGVCIMTCIIALIAVAMVVCRNCATFISPMVPATLLGVGLADVDIKDHIKNSFLWVWGFRFICMIVAVLFGIMPL